MAFKWLRFTGDYAKLKGMGFGFQKLYAGNHMQWAKSIGEYNSSVRVWKKGSDITFDGLGSYFGSFYANVLAQQPFTHIDGIASFVVNTKTFEVLFGEDAKAMYRKEQNEMMDFWDMADKKYPCPKGVNSPDWAWGEQRRLLLADGIEPYEAVHNLMTVNLKELAPLIELQKLGWVELVESE